MVQFAEGLEDQCEYAIKFFLDYDAFLTEAALYAACFPHIREEVSDDVLARADAASHRAESGAAAVSLSQVAARFLPQVEAVCDGSAGGLEDPRGRWLPPCIVMEKGESLHDWSDRAEPDLFTSLAVCALDVAYDAECQPSRSVFPLVPLPLDCQLEGTLMCPASCAAQAAGLRMQVLSNISKRLADMHEAGYVHRDLKPANVMWLPRANRWTVIDFGCVARIGEVAHLSFTLAYAAPEVARAFVAGERSMHSHPALDSWSLGVMAFELLTGAPAFNLLTDGRRAVRSARPSPTCIARQRSHAPGTDSLYTIA